MHAHILGSCLFTIAPPNQSPTLKRGALSERVRIVHTYLPSNHSNPSSLLRNRTNNPKRTNRKPRTKKKKENKKKTKEQNPGHHKIKTSKKKKKKKSKGAIEQALHRLGNCAPTSTCRISGADANTGLHPYLDSLADRKTFQTDKPPLP